MHHGVMNKRKVRHTRLVYGEGLCEDIFLAHLRALYSHNCGIYITIKHGRGGNAKDLVVEAARYYGTYNNRIVVLDNDKPEEEMRRAREEAKKRNIELIENTPCLEALLLAIKGVCHSQKNSMWCKAEFESKFISQNKRREPGEYCKVFPKEQLQEKRKALPLLSRLIEIMGG